MDYPAVEAFRGGEGLIRVVGHRGARGVMPENSMCGFLFALSIGVDLLEFDVVLTADGIPVITHNHHLHEPTFRGREGKFLVSGTPKVSELPWSALKTYDIGRLDGSSAYGRRFPDQAQLDGVRVPRLGELLDLVARPEHRGAHLMMELKSDPDLANDGSRRSAIVEAVVEEVRARKLVDRTVLHGFDHDLLAECRRQAPDMPASYLTRLTWDQVDAGEESSRAVSWDFKGREERIPDMVRDAGGSLWCPYFRDVGEREVSRARELGLCVAAWTVNEPDDIGRMIELEVDAIVSDYPGRVQRGLADRGFGW